MSQPYQSGDRFDRYMAHNEQSTIHRMKETYWTTKQVVIKKLGKKEDEHVVASDSQLDSKLEVFRAIQRSSMELLRVLEKYQDRLCTLSQEENSMGRFLKQQSKLDKTRAGKMSAAVGKSLSFTSQQRLALRVPLVRLYQEVETFRYRAISDTLMTINRMESARTEYRGALLWMKDISEVLDPDTYKQLEKFRKVQAQVKKTKARFDKLKLDVMQKVDLLAASRCNMYSHVLANYQSTLLHFWAKTSRTMSAVAESFKGYQYYEFNMLKELCEPTRKLAEDTGSKEEADRDIDSEGDEDDDLSSLSKPHPPLLQPINSQPPPPSSSPSLQADFNGLSSTDDNVVGSEPVVEKEQELTRSPVNSVTSNELIDLGISSSENARRESMTNLLQAIDKEMTAEDEADKQVETFMTFGEDETIEEIKKRQDKEFDLDTGMQKVKEERKKAKARGKGAESQDLLSGDIELEDSEKDDMALLNEILDAPPSGEDEFSREWQAVFGNTPINPQANYSTAEPEVQQGTADFMPSQLLDFTGQMSSMNMQGTVTPSSGSQEPASGKTANANKKAPQKKGQTDMSAWFSLFADLDPLANPDAIGRKPEDMTDA